MKEQDKYNNVRIDQMQQSDVIVFLVDLIEDLCLDSGGDVNAIDSSRISEKICEALFTKYKSWVWGFVVRMFERGLSEEFGRWQRLTVKLLLSWMRQTEEGLRVEKSRHNQQEEEQHKRQAPHIYAENSARYGKWIRSNLQKKKCIGS